MGAGGGGNRGCVWGVASLRNTHVNIHTNSHTHAHGKMHRNVVEWAEKMLHFTALYTKFRTFQQLLMVKVKLINYMTFERIQFIFFISLSLILNV